MRRKLFTPPATEQPNPLAGVKLGAEGHEFATSISQEAKHQGYSRKQRARIIQQALTKKVIDKSLHELDPLWAAGQVKNLGEPRAGLKQTPLRPSSGGASASSSGSRHGLRLRSRSRTPPREPLRPRTPSRAPVRVQSLPRQPILPPPPPPTRHSAEWNFVEAHNKARDDKVEELLTRLDIQGQSSQELDALNAEIDTLPAPLPFPEI